VKTFANIAWKNLRQQQKTRHQQISLHQKKKIRRLKKPEKTEKKQEKTNNFSLDFATFFVCALGAYYFGKKILTM